MQLHCYDDGESVLTNAKVLKCDLKVCKRKQGKTKSHVAVVTLYQRLSLEPPKNAAGGHMYNRHQPINGTLSLIHKSNYVKL